MKKILSLILLFAFVSIQAQDVDVYALYYDFSVGQEYLVDIDPYTATYEIVDTLESVEAVVVGSSSFDHLQQRYMFVGVDNQNDKRLYNIDVVAPEIISDLLYEGFESVVDSSSFIAIPSELEYDMQYDVLYGLVYINNVESFVSVDVETGVVTFIAEIPEVEAIYANTSTFNSNDGEYMFLGIDTENNKRFYTIDVSDGSILHNPILGEGMGNNEMCYDNKTRQVYALARENSNFPFGDLRLVTIDPVTANTTIVGIIPDVDGYALGATTYIQDYSQFVFVGYDTNFDKRIYVIDALTGTLVANEILSENFVEVQCDNTVFANKFYEKETTLGIINPDQLSVLNNDGTKITSISPNPFWGDLEIVIPDGWGMIKDPRLLKVYNITGQLVYENTFMNQTFATNDLSDLTKGIYIVKVTSGTESFETKIVKK